MGELTLTLLVTPSINFYGRKDLAREPETGHGSHHTKDHEHSKANEEHVSKVQQVGHEHARRLQLSEPNDGVAKGPNGRGTRAKEGVPPPSVILSAKLVVHQQDSNLSARNNHDKVDNERESKDIVELVHPQTGHDEKEFHVGRYKGNDTSKDHTNRRL